MSVTDIYTLPSNYPKFDWKDWPESAAALVPEGYTHEFEKEAWNAIVDLLRGALANADVEWDDAYTTAAGARITEEYGDFRAAAINSVRHNIDIAIPVLRWGWANDPTFRGYIGRKDFRGVDDYGEDGADDVYPEYIVELAARLNFMLSVMAGEAAKVMQVEATANSSHDAEMDALLLYKLAGYGQSQSIHDAFCLTRSPKLLSTGQLLKSEYDATLKSCIMARIGYEHSFLSSYISCMNARRGVGLGWYHHTFISEHEANMDAFRTATIEGPQVILSQDICELSSIQSLSLGSFQGTTTSVWNAEIDAVRSLLLGGRGQSATRHCAEWNLIESCRLEAQGQSLSIHNAELVFAHNIEIVENESKTSVAASLDSAWWPPAWVDGGLWIRQSHSVTPNENGELVIT